MRKTFDAMQNTLTCAGAALNDVIQINLYLKNLSEDFDEARAVFSEYFQEGCAPARMTLTTDFLGQGCLCMMDGVAYKPEATT